MQAMTLTDALPRLERLHAEGRIVRGKSTDEGFGLLAALVHDEKSFDCPILPDWFAHFTSWFGGVGHPVRWVDFVSWYVTRIRECIDWQPTDWRRLEGAWFYSVLDVAGKYDMNSSSNRVMVMPVIDLWHRVMRGDEPSSDEWESAGNDARVEWNKIQVPGMLRVLMNVTSTQHLYMIDNRYLMPMERAWDAVSPIVETNYSVDKRKTTFEKNEIDGVLTNCMDFESIPRDENSTGVRWAGWILGKYCDEWTEELGTHIVTEILDAFFVAWRNAL